MRSHPMRKQLVLLLLCTFIAISGCKRAQAPKKISAAAKQTYAKPTEVASLENGRLCRLHDQTLLVVEGTPKQMGMAQGKLLKKEVTENVRDMMDTLKDRGVPKEKLAQIWKALEPHVPKCFIEEMEGLAEGSGVPLEDIKLIHAFPTMHHCTCAAAKGKATEDGKVYMARSLDYDLNIGREHVLQDNAVVVVCKPKDGIAHANVTWAGFLGSVTGMNAEGLAVGDMTSDSKDMTFEGMPMVFQVRKMLMEAHNLEEAIGILKAVPRTCGYNFLLADGKGGDVCAVEATKSRVVVFKAGQSGKSTLPHWAISDCVWRSNHFVNPELAKTQRDEYDPRNGSETDSWLRYFIFGCFLKENHGKLNARLMIDCLRQYDAGEPALHQVVFCATDLEMCVANALSPARTKTPGAQNQAFYHYSLKELLKGKIKGWKQVELPPRPEGPWPASATVGADKELKPKPPANEEEAARLKPFLPEPKKFAWIADPLRVEDGIKVLRLRFPSPMLSTFAENNMVWMEYYLPEIPAGEQRPGVVVLHILDGRFKDSRLISYHLAKAGTPALMVKLPLYGERRPKQEATMMLYLAMKKEQAAKEWLYQAVADVRRARTWLAARPEVDANRVGLCGVSLGGFVTALTIGVDGNVPRAVVCLAGGDFKTLMEKGQKESKEISEGLKKVGITQKALEDLLSVADPIGYASRVDRDSVSMVCALYDEVVPPESCRALWEAYDKPKIMWYPTYHEGMWDYMEEAARTLAVQFSKEVWTGRKKEK